MILIHSTEDTKTRQVRARQCEVIFLKNTFWARLLRWLQW